MSCGAELHIADDEGDNHATCRCQLEEGHDLPHRHVFGRDDLNGNRTEVVVTFFCDERDRCQICQSIDSGSNDGFEICRREDPRVAEALASTELAWSFEENPEARAREWQRWSCTIVYRDITIRREGATQDDALRYVKYALQLALEDRLGVPCGLQLCAKCNNDHRCEDQQEKTSC